LAENVDRHHHHHHHHHHLSGELACLMCRLVASLGPGDALGEMALLKQGGLRTATVQATTDCEVAAAPLPHTSVIQPLHPTMLFLSSSVNQDCNLDHFDSSEGSRCCLSLQLLKRPPSVNGSFARAVANAIQQQLSQTPTHICRHRAYAAVACSLCDKLQASLLPCTSLRKEKKRKEKTTPFGVNSVKSQVLYRAAPDVLA